MGINIWSLLIILVIVLLLFGTKKLRNMGTDLGGAIRGFKDAMKEGEKGEDSSEEEGSQIEHKSEATEPGEAAKASETTQSSEAAEPQEEPRKRASGDRSSS